jgi:putative flippase GtrA
MSNWDFAKKLLSMQLIRFVLVGVLNTGFSYLIYFIALKFIPIYQLANLIALLIGLLFSFKTQSALVFKIKNNRLLFRFTLGWLLIYLGNIAVIGGFIKLGASAELGGALALPFSVGLSYVIQKYFVFRNVS